jgi:hypothetical protein
MSTVAPLTATTLVRFDDASGASDYSLSASLDDRDGGLNSGRTQFDSRSKTPEEWPAFLVWAALGSRGNLDVQAHGGTVKVVAGMPSIGTQHDQTVTQHVPAGQTSVNVSLSPPAAGVPSFSGNAAVGDTKRTSDGWVTSVTLKLAGPASAPYGTWVVGKMAWTSRARAYRIQPDVGAEQAIFLAVGLPAETP